MAATYSQLNVLNDFAYEAFQYTDTTFKQLLNEQTGGTITTQSRPTVGNFNTNVFWASEVNKAKLADPSSQGTASAGQFRQLSQVDIKCGCVLTPYEWQSIGQRWIRVTPEQQAMLWGRTAAESFMRVKIESLVSSLVAAFGKGIVASGRSATVGTPDSEIAKVVDDQKANVLDIARLLSAQGKMGDLYGDVAGVIMHSNPYFAMQSANLSTYNELFVFGNSFISRTASGLPIFVTDLPILRYTVSSTAFYRTLLLRPMAAQLFENDDYEQFFDRANGKTWIETTAQAQQTFNLCLKGLTWADTGQIHPTGDTSTAIVAADANPSGHLAGLNAQTGRIDNPKSWERVGTDESRAVGYKELPGVMLITKES